MKQNLSLNKELNLELNPKELVLMSNLYLDKDFPYNFLTLEQISNILNVSRDTSINVTKGLVKKGCLTKQRGLISFYYPIVDKNIKRFVMNKLGFVIE